MSFSKIGCRDCNFAASKRNAGITADRHHLCTVTKLRLGRIVHARMASSSRGSTSRTLAIFIDDLRLVIAHAIDLVRDLFKLRPAE